MCFYRIIVVGIGIGLLLAMPFIIIDSCASHTRKNEIEAITKNQQDSLILTEREMDYWVHIYGEAVKRGVWYPGRVANNAIIELRRKVGEE